tara:strand:- start:7292 stop:8086 length:795 start_codon:yes stop_codon:yes gene_type:complete
MYILIKPTHRNAGMFSYIWETLRGMHRYPDQQYYIEYSGESCYYDQQLQDTQGITNVWDYYFEQPHTSTIPEYTEVIDTVSISHDEQSEYRYPLISSEIYKERRKEYCSVLKQHIKLLPHMSKKVDEFYEKHFKGKSVVGIHCRGTDHPDAQPIENYYKEIDHYLESYDYLFITSDEQKRVDSLKSRYGEKVIEYNATFRSISTTPLHYGNHLVNSPYFIGEDVIVEAYLLSKVNMMLCCTNSNVNFFSRALNENLPYQILTGQ